MHALWKGDGLEDENQCLAKSNGPAKAGWYVNIRTEDYVTRALLLSGVARAHGRAQ